MARITGIGGVFFKSKGESKALAAWYQKHLGMPLADFGGAVLRWPDDKAEDRGMTVWHLAGKDSQWFSPSASSFMGRRGMSNVSLAAAEPDTGSLPSFPPKNVLAFVHSDCTNSNCRPR